MDSTRYLVSYPPGDLREIIQASSPRAALRTFCRQHGRRIARKAQVRIEPLDDALERGESELHQAP